ncbi:MAG: ABC transporter permease [Myxococcales bacterium]|jgi:putative ABC transport system permease protein|nr:ABC transporter permease [Myxococcales bacterium]
MIPISYNVRSLAVRKTSTAAAGLGMALVVFVFSSVLMLSNGLTKTLGRSAADDVVVVLRKGSDNELSSGIEEGSMKIAVAAAGSGAKAVGEIVTVILLDKVGEEGVSNVQVRGVPEEALAFRPTARIVAGRAPKPGSDEAIVGKAIRGRFKGLDIGQKFELKKNRSCTVVGVFEDGGSSFESEAWADIHVVRTAFGREGLVSSIRVRLPGGSGAFDGFKANVEQNRQLGLHVMREADFYEKQSQMTSMFISITGTLIAVFFSIAAMIGAAITMHSQVAHRQREIGTLRALGFSRLTVLTSFLIESIVLAILGGAVGAAASLLLGFVEISTMNFATWSEICLRFEPTPGILVRSMILAVVMGVVGGFFPAIKAARTSPVAAMRA